MRRIVVVSAILVLAASLLLAAGQASAQTYKVKVANWYAPDHPVNLALKEKFLPMVKEGTQGKVEAFIYDSGQLGGEREFTEGVRIGTIEMGITGSIERRLPRRSTTSSGTLACPSKASRSTCRQGAKKNF